MVSDGALAGLALQAHCLVRSLDEPALAPFLADWPGRERPGRDNRDPRIENVRELLDIRNFMDTLREGGIDTGGPAAFSHGDRQAFANQLDRFLDKHRR